MLTCNTTDCKGTKRVRGLCTKHYQQVRKHGHILTKSEISEIRRELRKRSSGNLGKKWSEEAKMIHSEKLKGRTLNTGRTHFKKGAPSWNKDTKGLITAWNKGLKGVMPPAWNKGLWGYNSGEKNGNWKGGVHTENNALRRTKRYASWRTAIFERDNYTCQHCDVRGVYLEADHIKPFAFFPELRFELTNGRTLCKECHMKTPTYKKHSYQEVTS